MGPISDRQLLVMAIRAAVSFGVSVAMIIYSTNVSGHPLVTVTCPAAR
jgi:hypothetical protein